MKKFDVVLMNPPYDRNLHLKFLEKTISIAENVISVQPCDYFTNINIQTPLSKKLSEFIDDVEIISSNDADKFFNISSSFNIGLFTVKAKNAKGFKVKYHELEDIINKIRRQKSIRSSINCRKGDAEQDPKYFTSLRGASGYAKNWHLTLEEIFTGDPRARIKFDSAEELDNFVSSVKETWPYKLMYIVDDNAAVIAHLPFMSDYTEPWTDERFYKYFNITKDEQKIIEEYADKIWKRINK